MIRSKRRVPVMPEGGAAGGAQRSDPSVLSQVADAFVAFQKILVGTLLFLLTSLVIAAAIQDLLREVVVVDPIQVPEDLQKRGYQSNVVTQRLVDEINSIRQGATTLRERRPMLSVWEQSDISLPGTGVSLRSVTSFLRQFFGFVDVRITGEIIIDSSVTPHAYWLRLRAGKKADMPSNVHAQTIDELVWWGARAVMQKLDPYILASYSRKNDREGALNLIHQILTTDPADDDAWAYTLWGLILQDEGDVKTAAEKYRRATELDSSHFPAWNNWGRVLLDEDKLDDAEEKFRIAIDANPKVAIGWSNLGLVLWMKKDFAGAYNSYETASGLDPRNADILVNLGRLLVALDRDHEAVDNYKRALDLNPRHSPAWFYWGLWLAAHHDESGAIEHYRRAVNFNPKHARALREWGLLLDARGDSAGALEKFEAVIALQPNSDLGKRAEELRKALAQAQASRDMASAGEEAAQGRKDAASGSVAIDF